LFAKGNTGDIPEHEPTTELLLECVSKPSGFAAGIARSIAEEYSVGFYVGI
jgi:hypothetical protein